MRPNFLVLLISIFSVLPLWGQKVIHPEFEINSAYEEREPIPNSDGSVLYFWRREMPSNTGGQADPGDIWFSTRRRDGSWNPARNIGKPLNGKGHDFVWQVSPDEDTLWVMQVPPGVREGGIAYSVRTRQGYWSVPIDAHIRNFNYQGQYKDYYMTPERIMLLPNEGENTYGGTDIYISFPINDTAWSEPVNLGPTINTVGDEDAPFLAEDGVTLYFNSNGHEGLGDHDIFMTKRLDNTWRNWSKPVNIGAPINTPGYDFDFFVTDNGKRLFWCSDQGSLGSNDIFEMDLNSCELDVYPGGDQTLCQGAEIRLEAGFAMGRIDYQWLKNGSPIRGATQRDLLVRESGVYQLQRRKDGCVNTSQEQRITFVPPPEPTVESYEDILCLDDSIQLSAVVRGGGEYQWLKNKLEIPNANGKNYWVKTPGNYSVKVSLGACTNVSPALNLRRFTPPGIFTEADTVNGMLPILPRWLWTNKLPKSKGDTYIRAISNAPTGATYVLSSVERGSRVEDRIDGFFPNGLFRLNFPVERKSDLSQRFIDTDNDGNLIVADNDTYLSKYRPDGRLLWKKEVSRQRLTGLAVDDLGSVYTSGRFNDQMIISGMRYKAANRGSLFLAKHSSRGELLWVKTFPIDWYKYDFGNGLHTDCDGNVYVAGGYKIIANFEKKILRGAVQGDNYFLAKFSPEGDLFWAQSMDTGKRKYRTADFHTDCEGTSYLVMNSVIYRYDTYGKRRWRGDLLEPNSSLTLKSRIHSSDGDLYIAGFSDRTDFFVSKLNRLDKQTIIWQDKGASNVMNQLPAISGDQEGSIWVAGNSKGKNFPGAQFDLTSNSQGFVMKYGRPDFKNRKEPMTLCDDGGLMLYTQVRAGLRYQWIKDGKDIPGANQASYKVERPGTYQVRAYADYCERISGPQQIRDCNDDLEAAPPITAAEKPRENIPPPPPPREEPKPQPVSTERPVESDISYGRDGIPTRIKKRRIKTQEEIVIRNPKATITIWDHAAEDLDTVSVNVNGEWIIEQYGLKKKKAEFEFTFRPGNNFITLYAHNLGSTPPNTAAVMVDDGESRKTLVLRSNLKNCGMLRVRLE
ncbi:MAG: hypothetical protein R8P61_16660 [Bacteroidia bacterium]|nr:hypothetical protein [Bacteroidia bacterium]